MHGMWRRGQFFIRQWGVAYLRIYLLLSNMRAACHQIRYSWLVFVLTDSLAKEENCTYLPAENAHALTGQKMGFRIQKWEYSGNFLNVLERVF